MSNYYQSSQSVYRLCAGNSEFINTMLISQRGRELPTTIALAMLVAGGITLPGGEIESPEAYFTQTASALGLEFLGVLNEVLPVDYRRAIEIAKGLFLTRYEIATCPFNAFGVVRTHGLASIFGLNAHLGEDVLDCMRANGQRITDLYDRFKTIEAEMRKVV